MQIKHSTKKVKVNILSHSHIAVLGAGSWGTALSNVLVENGHDVMLWSFDQNQVEDMNTTRKNAIYLPDFELPDSLVITNNLQTAVEAADIICFVVPTTATREVAKSIVPFLTSRSADQKPPIIMHASKGLEQKTHLRISEILKDELDPAKYHSIVALSGPSHAEEVIKHDITAITAASENLTAAEVVQRTFMNDYFRVYTNADIIGVEFGGALKNIIALGAGAIHGMGYGDNAKAALMTRGLAEISRLGMAFGADPMTFIGLSGIGDLIVTCTSPHSRNWRAGDQLGRGIPIETVQENMGMVIEGVSTASAAYELASIKGVEMPITEVIYGVIYEGKSPKIAVKELMQRERTGELQFTDMMTSFKQFDNSSNY